MKHIKSFQSFNSIANPNLLEKGAVTKGCAYNLSESNREQIWYHGSPNSFEAFRLKQGTLLDHSYTSPIFLTSSKSFALAYAGFQSPHLYSVEVETSNLFDYRTLASGYELDAYLHYNAPKEQGKNYDISEKLYNDIFDGNIKGFNPDNGDRIYSAVCSGDYSSIEHVGFYEWLKKHDYDGAYVEETGTLNLFIFNADKLQILNCKTKDNGLLWVKHEFKDEADLA